MIDTKNEEDATIDSVLKLLEEKHSQYKPEQYAHYVVKGEDEDSAYDFGSDNYCEKCIDKAVKESRRKYAKERAEKLLLSKNFRNWGYAFTWGWNDELSAKFLIILIANNAILANLDTFESEVNKAYPKKCFFGYRYYQLDSRASFETCAGCGIKISSCVTADKQEIEHWRDCDDDEFIVKEMSEDVAYELYEIMQFINQADEEVYMIGLSICDRILKINNALLPAEK